MSGGQTSSDWTTWGIGMNQKSEPAGAEIHVFVAAISPFCFVTFDSDDDPIFTLEQVNSGQYDYLKLCRSTTGLDPEIEEMSGMAAVMTYTGALLFPRMKGVDRPVVLEAVNRLLLALLFGGIRFDGLAPEDIGFGMLYETGYFTAGGGGNGEHFSQLVKLQHRSAGSFDNIKLIGARTFLARDIHRAVGLGRPIVKQLPALNPTLFLNGLTHFRKLQFAESLVFIW